MSEPDDKAAARRAALEKAVDRHLIRYGGGFVEGFIERAAGAFVYDDTGREIIDFTSGQMCSTLGHNHPAVVAAVRKSCDRAFHLFSGMLAPEVVDLCRELAELLPPTLQKVMLLNTGSEVNELALRMAKLVTGKFEVVGLTGSFHGFTGGASAATYAVGRRGGGPVMPGQHAIPAPNSYRCPVRHCRDRCDLTCLEVGMEQVDARSVGSLAAVVAEPILSTGGVIVPPAGYFPRLLEMCRAREMLLILDEAQTALGRVGSMFAFEQDGATPDFLCLSKTLGGGLPLAALITGRDIEEQAVEAGFVHVTSHASDPMPALVGLAVLETIARERLVSRAVDMGRRLERGLRDLQDRHPVIGDVRGRGLLWGVEIVRDRDSREPAGDLGATITHRAMQLGLSMNIVSQRSLSSVWRIAPPLTVDAETIDRGIDILDRAISDCLA